MNTENFKGVVSTHHVNGRLIVSGQIVLCHGRINSVDPCEVFFHPDFGFKIQGNNLADAYVTGIIVEVGFWASLFGNIKLLLYNTRRRIQVKKPKPIKDINGVLNKDL